MNPLLKRNCLPSFEKIKVEFDSDDRSNMTIDFDINTHKKIPNNEIIKKIIKLVEEKVKEKNN